ncbi:transcriptional regulator [Sorangium sp. So ce118]
MNTMEDLLGAMWLISPLGLAMIACVAIGFAVTASEALGRERGLRKAREHAHDDEESALTEAKEKAERELERYQRLLDCHVDALSAATTGAGARPVPWPGRVIESFCATIPAWQRTLAENTGLAPRDVERLLNSELPISPALARQLETFTGAPARYWERLWRLHDDYRTDAEDTVVVKLGEPITRRESSAGTAMAPAPRSVPPPGPPTVPARALDVPPPVVPPFEGASRSPRAKLPPPPRPRQRPPLPARTMSGAEFACRAAELTSFPVQQDDSGSMPARGADSEDVERSPLGMTLPGVGSQGAD